MYRSPQLPWVYKNYLIDLYSFVPALVLLLPGTLLDGTIWTAARQRKPKTHLHRCFEVFFITVEAFLRAAIAPTGWLVLSFQQQKYYTCAFFGPFFLGGGGGKAQWIIPPKYATSNLDEGRESWRKSIKPAVKLRAGLWCSQPCRFFWFQWAFDDAFWDENISVCPILNVVTKSKLRRLWRSVTLKQRRWPKKKQTETFESYYTMWKNDQMLLLVLV